jgi:hypothetical protein
MNNQKNCIHDENLMVVSAVEGFSAHHKLPSAAAFLLLNQTGAISSIRKNYESLHTQSLDEVVDFVEDYFVNNFSGGVA